MLYVKYLHHATDPSRSNNGGDYDEWILYDSKTGRGEFRSSADFPICPFCGSYSSCWCEYEPKYKGPIPSKREMAAARRGVQSFGWQLARHQ